MNHWALANLFICLLAVTSQAFSAEPISSELEIPDTEAPLSVVHKMRYPLEKKLEAEISGVYQYGDKFLRSQGIELEAKYFLREKISIGIGAGSYQSSEVAELKTLKSVLAAPLTYNPRFAVRAIVSFYPVYGKMALGSSILNFRLFADIGPQFTGLKPVSVPASVRLADPEEMRWKVGPYSAIGAWFALNDHLSAQVKLSMSWQPPYLTGSDWRRTTGISLGVGGRFSP